MAWVESKAAGGTPAAWTDLIGKDQYFLSTGGALNSSFTANSFFDMLFEPPFVDDLSYKSESITALDTRQENRFIDQSSYWLRFYTKRPFRKLKRKINKVSPASHLAGKIFCASEYRLPHSCCLLGGLRRFQNRSQGFIHGFILSECFCQFRFKNDDVDSHPAVNAPPDSTGISVIYWMYRNPAKRCAVFHALQTIIFWRLNLGDPCHGLVKFYLAGAAGTFFQILLCAQCGYLFCQRQSNQLINGNLFLFCQRAGRFV